MRLLEQLNPMSKFRWIVAFLQRGDKDALSRKRQLFEMAYLFVNHGLGPNYYKDAGFSSSKIPWNIKKLYLSSRQYYKTVWKLNNYDYRKLSQNKMAEKAMFSLYNIPTPLYLGLLDEKCGTTPHGSSLKSIPELEDYLKSIVNTRLCFKLLEGWGGKGFQVVDILEENGNILLSPLDYMNDSEALKISVSDYVNNFLGYSKEISYLLEKYFIQHPLLNSINPSSVNTIRMWVVNRLGEPETRVIGAFLRVGRAGSLVDNMDRGGFFCNVDLDTGILDAGEQRFDKKTHFDKHPDTGSQIKGRQIPYWEEVKNMGCKALSIFPGINFAGIDMAVSDEGPVVIEMNVPPDPSGGVRLGYCRRDLLSDSPWKKDFY